MSDNAAPSHGNHDPDKLDVLVTFYAAPSPAQRGLSVVPYVAPDYSIKQK